MMRSDDKPKGCFALTLFAIALLALLGAAMACGCKRTVYVPVETHHYHTDSVQVVKLLRDSFLLRDSVYVERHGDTVMIEKWRDRYRVKEVHDTLTKAVLKIDSIAVPYPVEKPLGRWQQFKQDVGGFALGGCVALLAFAVVWLIRRFRR